MYINMLLILFFYIYVATDSSAQTQEIKKLKKKCK